MKAFMCKRKGYERKQNVSDVPLCIKNGSVCLLIHKGLHMLFLKIVTGLVNSHSPAAPSQNQWLFQPLLLDLCASHLPSHTYSGTPDPASQSSSIWTGPSPQGSSKNVLIVLQLHPFSAAGTLDGVFCFVFPFNQRSRVSF